MDRQQVMAVFLAFLMVGSAVVYGLAFAFL